MRPNVFMGPAAAVVAWLCAGLPCAAQTCSSPALETAAHEVIGIRHQLHTVAVPVEDPQIPPAVATQLGRLKDALAAAARSALACAPAGVSADALQQRLAEALHANLGSSAEPFVESRGKQDLGPYGAQLAVQVFELSSRPRVLEVSFRYGIECGDDNLLLVFEAEPPAAAASGEKPAWHELLRWDAPRYRTVDDAMGDFVLLTPLTGSYQHPVWRFVVAHGHPSCAAGPHPSRFDLDLLSPSGDDAQPTVTWHFEHPYLQGTGTPRLATTEDTLEFRLVPAATAEAEDHAVPAASAGTASAPAARPEVYSFRLNARGSLEPVGVSSPGGPASASVQRR